MASGQVRKLPIVLSRKRAEWKKNCEAPASLEASSEGHGREDWRRRCKIENDRASRAWGGSSTRMNGGGGGESGGLPS